MMLLIESFMKIFSEMQLMKYLLRVVVYRSISAIPDYGWKKTFLSSLHLSGDLGGFPFMDQFDDPAVSGVGWTRT